MEAYGRHIIIEFTECSFDKINNQPFLEELLVRAAKKAGATVLSSHSHMFSPQGVSALVIISESHLSCHSFPEVGLVMADFFTCGPDVDPRVCMEYVKEELEAKGCYETFIVRTNEGQFKE